MNYVRSIVTHGVSLRTGAIYQVLPPEANDGALLRIADETMGEAGSEGGYLYPPDLFEAVQRDELPDLPLEMETQKKTRSSHQCESFPVTFGAAYTAVKAVWSYGKYDAIVLAESQSIRKSGEFSLVRAAKQGCAGKWHKGLTCTYDHSIMD